ncbi:metal-sulfur cluster assembly factor [Pontibacter akesuensis]|uniref:Metal-sulfur cluster biosynthetic enzyme n=1 Tax=Pontibacter akesuensis TaxID=388950 RepID=A0A1I7GEY2_9BACT|nr:metal-sulfur cluster assembly factor [Pontibacter akesuensis]GHA57142.1 aromatic ring hydroxylating enzyme [Pontibacter akesuensis]SFU47022.1 Metal-sulfur cluster biosynthetic enzyme [Pontibacter akesuensis]
MEMQTPDIGKDVFETLRYIIDPELGVNIVDLGLVYEVSLDGKLLEVKLTLTTPGCPMSGTIVTATEQILLKRFPNLEVKVNLVWSPPWSPDMITPEGMAQLEGR